MRHVMAMSLLLLLVQAPVAAQGLSSFAVEQTSGRPLRCINALLLDTLGAVVDSTRTTHDGLFQLMAPAPRCPEELRRDRIEGEVVTAYGIDTIGVVDTSTVLPIKVSHALFFVAVWDVLPRLRYENPEPTPGVACELKIQRFTFGMRGR